MKSYFLSILLSIFLFQSLTAQIDDSKTESQKDLNQFNSYSRHELSLDVLAGIIVPAINPRYEYILNRYSSLGGDVSINLDSDASEIFDYIEKWSATSFYRQYFFSKEDYGAKGFYGEGFLKGYGYENEDFFGNGSETTEKNKYFEMALGVGIGWKWVSNSGFLIDLNFGAGRNFGLADDPDDRTVTGRFGLNFGWRF